MGNQYRPGNLLEVCRRFPTWSEAERLVTESFGEHAHRSGVQLLDAEGGVTFVRDPGNQLLDVTRALIGAPKELFVADIPADPCGILAIGGKSGYTSPETERARSNFARRLTRDARECVVVWHCPAEHTIPLRPAAGLDSTDVNHATPHLARLGYGLVYALERLYSQQGNRRGTIQRVACIRFAYGRSQRTKFPVIRVTVHREERIAAGKQIPADAVFRGKHASIWQRLYKRATRLFEKSCKDQPAQTTVWRRWYGTQINRNPSEIEMFRRSIQSLNWTEALDRVQDAWQLGIVADIHATSRFDHPGRGRPPTRGRRINAMLRQYTCTPERRELLEQMRRNFLIPSLDDWNVPDTTSTVQSTSVEERLAHALAIR